MGGEVAARMAPLQKAPFVLQVTWNEVVQMAPLGKAPFKCRGSTHRFASIANKLLKTLSPCTNSSYQTVPSTKSGNPSFGTASMFIIGITCLSSTSPIIQYCLHFYMLVFLSSTTPKPQLIVTPLHDSHVQASVICCRKYGLQLKVQSGGHDYMGLSYTSDVPFIIVDMANIRLVDVDVEDGSAWVQVGARYNIAEKSRTYGFPAGTCPTVGVGGHLSGGGYGALVRKFGLAADNIIDARLVNAKGEILDRKSMGEDLFWAIRGGGGGSFGIIFMED
ncbi:hypothetical protein Sjap_024693 [Stephania japonica]|uniref:FAD-binding PCMH-type domain-containing protein n=1 Tax=Stephania japonica TaxID=461633 RepID=A0AAP0HP73_9MAGN